MVRDDERNSSSPDELAPTACPSGPASGEVTRILGPDRTGRTQAAEKLLPLVYEELRELAAAKMAQEKPADAAGHGPGARSLHPSGGLEKAPHWNSRGHFFAAAAEAMRRILVEQRRAGGGSKPVGGYRRIELSRWIRRSKDPSWICWRCTTLSTSCRPDTRVSRSWSSCVTLPA